MGYAELMAMGQENTPQSVSASNHGCLGCLLSPLAQLVPGHTGLRTPLALVGMLWSVLLAFISRTVPSSSPVLVLCCQGLAEQSRGC